MNLCSIHHEALRTVGPGQSAYGPPTCPVCDALEVVKRWETTRPVTVPSTLNIAKLKRNWSDAETEAHHSMLAIMNNASWASQQAYENARRLADEAYKAYAAARDHPFKRTP